MSEHVSPGSLIGVDVTMIADLGEIFREKPWGQFSLLDQARVAEYMVNSIDETALRARGSTRFQAFGDVWCAIDRWARRIAEAE